MSEVHDAIDDTATIDGVARRVAQLAISLLPRDKVVLAIIQGAILAIEETKDQPHPHTP